MYVIAYFVIGLVCAAFAVAHEIRYGKFKTEEMP